MSEKTKNFKPKITISGPRYTINIGADTIRALNRPSHICLLQSLENRSIAVTPCEPGNLMSFKTPELFLRKKNIKFVIHSKAFVQEVIHACDLDHSKTYVLHGTYEESRNRVVFFIEPE